MSVTLSRVFYRIGYFIPELPCSACCCYRGGSRGREKEINMSFSRLAAAAVVSILVAAPAGTQPATAVRTIHLSNFKIEPNPIQLAAGQPVTLVNVNDSGR